MDEKGRDACVPDMRGSASSKYMRSSSSNASSSSASSFTVTVVFAAAAEVGAFHAQQHGAQRALRHVLDQVETVAVRQAQIQVAMSYNYTAYVVAGLRFVAFSWPFIRFTDWLTARQQAREQIGGLV